MCLSVASRGCGVGRGRCGGMTLHLGWHVLEAGVQSGWGMPKRWHRYHVMCESRSMEAGGMVAARRGA